MSQEPLIMIPQPFSMNPTHQCVNLSLHQQNSFHKSFRIFKSLFWEWYTSPRATLWLGSMKLGVESILKLSNAWAPQIYYMISMVVMPIKAEHAVTKASRTCRYKSQACGVGIRKGNLKPRNLGCHCQCIVSKCTQFLKKWKMLAFCYKKQIAIVVG